MGLCSSGVVLTVLLIRLAGGSISGTVRDAETGDPMIGAIVTLPDLHRTALSDSTGRYRLGDVPAGPQHMVVRRIGYARRTFHALVPGEGVLEIDVTLVPQPFQLSPIDIDARLPVRGLEDGAGSGFPVRGLSMAAVRQDPLLLEPDVLQALGGGEVALRPESPSGLHLRAGSSDQTAFLLDGFPVLNPFHSGGTFSAWNPDALSRVDLYTVTAPAATPSALSGIVAATTREPGRKIELQGSLSNTQARVTASGPAGSSEAGYLLSVRSAFPGLVAHRRESSYLQGEGGDALGTFDARLYGGQLRLLGYGGRTEIETTARATADSAGVDPRRNGLEWDSRSLGVGWRREQAATSIEVRAWRVDGRASADWGRAVTRQEHLRSDRTDHAVSAQAEWKNQGAVSTAGLLFEHSRTSYRLRPDSLSEPIIDLDARTPVTTVDLRHQRPLTPRTEVEVRLATGLSRGRVRFSPEGRVRFSVNGDVEASAAFVHRYQFAQSLRNPESVLATIFPADLYVGSGNGKVPVAHGDLGVAALEYRPAANLRLGVQSFVRRWGGLVLVAPEADGPFVTTGFVTGTGNAHGVSIELARNSARSAVLLSYGYQRVRLEAGDTRYVPESGAAHALDAGLTLYPTATSSVRLGASSLLGRRATATLGGLEWEACNLLDQGCEFSGGTGEPAEPLGATRLPDYIRLDLGFRMHWHLRAAGRDWVVAAFGSATNLLGRRNVLTVAVDPSSGSRTQIEMRPRSPVVVGIDWQF